MTIRRLRKRVEEFEAERRRVKERHHERAQHSCDEFWELELEWVAFHLVRGLEPHFSLDASDVLRTLDGRFAVSRHRMDLRNLGEPRTQAMQEAMVPERWQRFLKADEEAAELMERLLELGDGAAVPEDYR